MRPFRAETEAALIFAILGQEPPCLAELREDLPAALVSAIGRCLEKRREDRCASAGQLLDDLRAVQHGRSPTRAYGDDAETASEGGTPPDRASSREPEASFSDTVVPTAAPGEGRSATRHSDLLDAESGREGSVADSGERSAVTREGSPVDSPGAAATGSAGSFGSAPRRAWWAAAAVALGMAGLLFWAGRPPAPPIAAEIDSVAVLPLRNLSGDPEQEFFADGITEALITDLSGIGALRVISRASVMSFKGTSQPPEEIASRLGVDALLEGSVLREGNRVAVSLQLVEGAAGGNLWAQRYERDASSLLALQGEIARTVAQALQVSLRPVEEELLTSERELDPAAYDAYLRGLFHRNRFNPADFEMAQQLFEESLAIDSENALAYSGLGSVWAYRMVLGVTPPKEGCPRWRDAIASALRLDESSAEAQLNLGELLFVCDWDWERAERAFRRGLELSPNHAEGHSFYSNFLSSRGRFDEATVHVERARDLDPLNHLYLALQGVQLEMEGRFEESVALLERAREMAPGFGFGNLPMSRSLVGLERWEEAFEALRAHLAGVGEAEAVAELETGFAEDGYKAAVLRAARALETSALARSRALNLVYLYDDAGDLDAALEWIEIAYEQRDLDMAYIEVLQLSDELRAHPRFREVVRRVG